MQGLPVFLLPKWNVEHSSLASDRICTSALASLLFVHGHSHAPLNQHNPDVSTLPLIKLPDPVYRRLSPEQDLCSYTNPHTGRNTTVVDLMGGKFPYTTRALTSRHY